MNGDGSQRFFRTEFTHNQNRVNVLVCPFDEGLDVVQRLALPDEKHIHSKMACSPTVYLVSLRQESKFPCEMGTRDLHCRVAAATFTQLDPQFPNVGICIMYRHAHDRLEVFLQRDRGGLDLAMNIRLRDRYRYALGSCGCIRRYPFAGPLVRGCVLHTPKVVQDELNSKGVGHLGEMYQFCLELAENMRMRGDGFNRRATCVVGSAPSHVQPPA